MPQQKPKTEEKNEKKFILKNMNWKSDQWHQKKYKKKKNDNFSEAQCSSHNEHTRLD